MLISLRGFGQQRCVVPILRVLDARLREDSLLWAEEFGHPLPGCPVANKA